MAPALVLTASYDKGNDLNAIKIAILLLLAFFSDFVRADCESELEQLVGYTIVASKTIERWYGDDGEKGDDFEGCEFGRTIVFSDRTKLTCTTYEYAYSYMPTAIIFAKSVQYNGKSMTLYKMLVEDELYDMSR